MIRAATDHLPVPSDEARAAIADLPRDVEVHDAFMADLPCMTLIETGGAAPNPGPLQLPLTVAAWNLERCLFPAESSVMLAATGAQVVLLSEMDHGMARSGQRDTTAALARALGMEHAFGVEFLELGLGSETERRFCEDDTNARGFHGNALMAAGRLHQPFLLRLPGQRFWFLEGGDQPRLGERMAIGAVLDTMAGQIIFVSTHLESNSDAPGRAAQIDALIDALEAEYPGLPVLIGGDLNSGNHIGGNWQDETLFDLAQTRGFAVHGGPEDQMTTRPSLITRWPDRAMKLDWFLSRGLQIGATRIIAALDPRGSPVSDHDLIVTEITGVSA